MNANSPESLAYTIKRACEVADVGRTKLYEEIAAGRIKTRKLGRRVLILSDDLRAWLESLPEAA